MLALKVPLKHAERTRQMLISNRAYNTDYNIKKSGDYILFPVKEKLDSKFEFVDEVLEKSSKKDSFKDIVKEKLSLDETDNLKTAYDQVGTIAIIEIDKSLENKQKVIGQALLDSNPNIRTVLKKKGIHGGEFRTQDMIFLAGENTKETIHKENNCRVELNVEKVYFSPRLSTERKRIMQKVKPGEEVLVMFSGAAPYPCVISKNTGAKQITGIELNPIGHGYGIKNIELNRLKNVRLKNGDVRIEVPKLNKKFDRILMPLPKSAEDFLDTALIASKKGTIIHFYDFLNENEFDLAKKKIDNACKKNNIKYKILEITKCGQHAPHVFRICVDFQVF